MLVIVIQHCPTLRNGIKEILKKKVIPISYVDSRDPTSMVHVHPSTSIVVHLRPSWSIYVHRGPPWSIYVHRGPSTSIVVHLRPSWSIYVHRGPSWSIVVHRRSSSSIDEVLILLILVLNSKS